MGMSPTGKPNRLRIPSPPSARDTGGSGTPISSGPGNEWLPAWGGVVTGRAGSQDGRRVEVVVDPGDARDRDGQRVEQLLTARNGPARPVPPAALERRPRIVVGEHDRVEQRIRSGAVLARGVAPERIVLAEDEEPLRQLLGPARGAILSQIARARIGHLRGEEPALIRDDQLARRLVE